MIGLIDYGAGNMQSVANALVRLELPYVTCRTARDLQAADRILLPGVGHWKPAVTRLQESGLFTGIQAAARRGKPLLGICLGMQLLLESSEEAPDCPGLGLIAGDVVRLQSKWVPHMGWNRIGWHGVPYAEQQRHGQFVYFAHSYAARTRWKSSLLASVEVEGDRLPAVIAADRVVGVQFHPEKSGDAGLDLLRELLTTRADAPC